MSRTEIIVNEHHYSDREPANIIMRPMWPNNVKDRQKWATLDCDTSLPPLSDLAEITPSDAVPFDNSIVMQVGEHLLGALEKHQGVSAAISSAINAGAQVSWPIQFHMSGFTTESLPLETLYSNSEFLALAPRFSLSRVVQNTSQTLSRNYLQPLKMVAVLAAFERDPSGEWHAILESIQRSKFDVELTVLLASDQLQEEITNANLSWVHIERIPENAEELVSKILYAQPQVLHFFCHGVADQSGALQIATPSLVRGYTDVPLFFEARHFAELRSNVWLVVLNSCEGATSTTGAQSLAYNLVDAGIPAAIGVREVVGANDANTFCGAFYLAALRDLKQKLVGHESIPIDWAPYVARARASMCEGLAGPVNQTAGLQKSWTLHVLYQREAPLNVHTVPTGNNGDDIKIAKLMGELKQARALLNTLHPDTPDQIETDIRDYIANVEAQLDRETMA